MSLCVIPLFPYRKDIDGLRALAVILVVFYHIFPQFLKGGFIGVDIFFVISGYLISSILYNDLDNQKFSFCKFYINRAKRLLPVLCLVLLSTFCFSYYFLLENEFSTLGKHIMASVGFFQNINLLLESGYFDISAKLKPLLHIWSLGVEEQFYIIFPFIVFFSYKFFLRKYFILIICLIAII